MKRVQTSLFLAVVGILGMCGVVTAFSGAGSGTESDPYIITTVEQLQEMNDDLTACYELDCDIDASATQGWNGGAGFEPVGNPTGVFTGIFDGRGHTITGLYINRPLAGGIGLFGYLRNGAEVRNVGLIDAEVYGKYYVGTLAGTSYWGDLIHNCYATGEVTISADGSNDAKSGGLVGSQAYSTISRCYSAVNVRALSSRYQIGGLCGYSAARIGDPPALIENCYSTGTVTSNGFKVGGLLGDADGENSTVSKCYSVGRVNGFYKKGLVGYNFRSPIIRDSYWDVQTSGCSSSYGGTGKQSAQMMRKSTFIGWDFVNIWDIVENQGYPFLIIEYGDLIGLEITGPNEAAENFSTSYKAIAYYDNNMTRDVADSALWAIEPNTAANIDENGVLTTQDVVIDQPVTILAVYSEEDVTFDAGKVVNIFPTCPGTALQFDGENDYVSVPDDASLNITGDITISAWVYITEGGLYQAIVTKCVGGGGQNNPFDFRTETSAEPQLTLVRADASGHERVYSTKHIPLREWHHVLVRVENKVPDFYVNGIITGKYADTTFTRTPTGNTKPLLIGKRDDRLYFNGTIDEIAIYNRALSAEEIQANIHMRLTGDEPNLVGYWDLDEGEGQIVYDLSGNGNNGYLGGDPCGVDAGDAAWVYSDAPMGRCSLHQAAAVATKNAIERKTALLEEVTAGLANEWTAHKALEKWLESGDYGDLYKGDIVTAKQKIHSAMQHEGQQSIDALEKSVEKLTDALSSLGYEPELAANIDENGVLTTQDIVTHESATIPASYSEGDVTFDAEKVVNISPTCPGTALQFDGVDDYVGVSDDPSLRFSQYDSFSVSFWAKPFSNGWLLSKMRADERRGVFGYSLLWEASTSRFRYIVEKSWIGSTSAYTDSAPQGTWHYVTAIYDNKDIKIYLNGELHEMRHFGYDTGNTEPDKHFVIGARSWDYTIDGYFNGIIDEVAIYNRILSDEEIRGNMHTKLAGDEPNLVGHWNFDEGEGQIAYDLSGNGNNGQLGSTPSPDASDPAWVDSDAPIGICSLYKIAILAVDRAVERKTALLEELPAALVKEWAAYEVLEELLGSLDYGDLNKGDIVTAKQKIFSATQHEEQSIDSLEKSIDKLEDALSALGYDPAGQATNPNPANGATHIETFADLSWTSDPKALSHDVYFGTTNPPPFIGNQTATTFDPGIMAGNTTYYWRIDEVNASWTTTGTVWTFSTAGGLPPM